jgi:SAM-dependent methyltransferase
MEHAERLRSERDFHNARFSHEDDIRAAQTKFYWAVERGAKIYSATVRRLAAGKDVLEYGCGTGGVVDLKLGAIAKSVIGIDISDVAIAKMNANNQAQNVSYQVMDASNLTLPENTFDLVFGSGIVHHLDTRQSAQEVSRVLRPGGNAVFAEPTGSNPLINLYRKMTPNARTPDEHPLVTTDLKIMRQYFRSVETTYFGLTTLAAMPLRTMNMGTMVRGLFEAIDTGIFAVPGLNRLAWSCLIVCTK